MQKLPAKGEATLRQCPLTCGLPTRMTEGGFAAACGQKLAQAKTLSPENSMDLYVRWCLACKGFNRPAELTIITPQEMIEMAKNSATTNKKASTSPASGPSSLPASPAGAGQVELCGICGQRPSTRKSLDIGICGTCDHLRRGVRNQPELIVKMLRSEHPEVLAGLGADSSMVEAVIIERDYLADTCEEIRKIVGAGEDDNLPLVVRGYVVNAMAEKVLGLESKLTTAQNELDDLRADRDRMLTLNNDLTAQLTACHDGSEDAVVAKWSGLPESEGYEALTSVLGEAIAQAATGKGRDRHANGQPFHRQPIIAEALSVGLGFTAGQARKKILEAVRCAETYPERSEGDLLGAINYTAATIIAMRVGRDKGGVQ